MSNITLPQLARLLFDELHNSCYRLVDDGMQTDKACKLARKVYKAMINDGDPNLSTETFKSNWVSFRDLPTPYRKTKVIAVYGVGMGYLLGHIKWWPEKICYGFYPVEGTVFAVNGLNDIQEYVQLLMSEWAAARKEQQQPVKQPV